jgi:ribonuclease P protein component
MLSRNNRIVKKRDFARIKRYGRSYFSGNIELRVSETRLKETRVGFIVGLKLSKKAVERNKTKRWLREIFRDQLPTLKNGQDILVIAKKNNKEDLSKDKIREYVKKAIKQAKITV